MPYGPVGVLHGLGGVVAIDLAIAWTGLSTWGFFWRQVWSWWGGTLLLLALLAASTWTFLAVPPQEMIAGMPFAPGEVEALTRIPVRGNHFAAFLGVSPLANLGALFLGRRDFSPQGLQFGLA